MVEGSCESAGADGFQPRGFGQLKLLVVEADEDFGSQFHRVGDVQNASDLMMAVKFTLGRSPGKVSRASRRKCSAVLRGRVPALVTTKAARPLSVTTSDEPGRSDLISPGA